MRRLPVRRLRRRIAVDLNQHKPRRVVGLLEDIKPQHAGLQPAGAGVQPRRRHERLERFRFHLDLHVDNQHKRVIAEIFSPHKRAGKEIVFCYADGTMAAKIVIPEDLKKELPPSKWGKILGATPIIMTVIATMLAGLASSEMTKAQYDRSAAAQLQSKAGDQWSYYQAKKLRSAVARNTLDLLAATAAGGLTPLDAAVLEKADAATVAALTKGEIPPATPAKFDDHVQVALDAVDSSKPETEVTPLLANVTPATLAESLAAAKDAANKFDDATKSINKASDKFDEQLMTGDQAVFRSFSAARLRYTAARYDTEARLNQSIAGIYELQVRMGNISAEKHHKRSGKFFMGMLAAQMAVIISTFAIAARQKNFLWSIAAAAGAAAVSFSLYVYLYV